MTPYRKSGPSFGSSKAAEHNAKFGRWEQRAKSPTNNGIRVSNELSIPLVQLQDNGKTDIPPIAQNSKARMQMIYTIPDTDRMFFMEKLGYYAWKFDRSPNGSFNVELVPIKRNLLVEFIVATSPTKIATDKFEALRMELSRPLDPAVSYCPSAGLFPFARVSPWDFENNLNKVSVIDMAANSIRKTIPVMSTYTVDTHFLRQDSEECLALSPDGTRLALFTSARNDILVWEIESARLLSGCYAYMRSLKPRYGAIALSHNNKQLVAIGGDKYKEVLFGWDLTMKTTAFSLVTRVTTAKFGITLPSFARLGLRVVSVAFLPDNSLAIGFRKSSIRWQTNKEWTSTLCEVEDIVFPRPRVKTVSWVNFSRVVLNNPNKVCHVVRIPELSLRNLRGHI